jgi:predicted RNA-binding Zn-ribbon protein involved in translation (DUF1610 family)
MSKAMLLMEVTCPYCHGMLTEGTRIVLDAYSEASNQDGQVKLSAIFGDYSVESELEIPEGTTVQFRCPKCDSSIMLQLACRLCGATMASVNLVKGGYLEFCTRRGCKGHALGGVGDVDEMMNLMNRMLETPYD